VKVCHGTRAFGYAAVDHVIDETHFAATKESGSHANASAARRTCTLIKYFGIMWSNIDAM